MMVFSDMFMQQGHVVICVMYLFFLQQCRQFTLSLVAQIPGKHSSERKLDHCLKTFESLLKNFQSKR